VLYICQNGKELQDKWNISKNIPKIVMLDISMPIMNGFESALWIKNNYPNVLIIALSMDDNEESLLKMIKNGAKSFLLKNIHPNELEKALNNIINNGSYYPEWVTNKVFASLGSEKKVKQSSIKLNEREREFLSFCATEMNYKEIAEKMFCSPRTVEGYRDNLCLKLELKSRVGLAIYAIKNGIV
jgi:DNA-binding NarL/FixJ family response regulator